MAVKTLPAGAGSFIKSEANGDYSRDVGTLASGSGKLIAGTVLGKLSSGGKLRPFDEEADTGIEVPMGILVYDADATDADATVVYVARSAEVWAERVVWENGGETAGKIDLANIGIVFR